MKNREIRWDKLDNTANLFPVIAREGMSNVYRVAVTLKEEIVPELLQQALERVLPYFDVFNMKLKRGLFWYYLESNEKPAPLVHEEYEYPCQYINPYANNDYQFRVTYYGRRINLEVFHALTDGNGALLFLKELSYCYLRLAHKELQEVQGESLSANTSLDSRDSYLDNYKQKAKKGYKTEKAVIIKGEKFYKSQYGVIQAYISLADIKRVSKAYGVTINQYLVSAYTYAIYKGYLDGKPSSHPISTCVPVNLRPYFGSETTKNFFAVVSAVFKPTEENYEFEDVLRIISGSLKEQICKEHLEELFSYNVSNQKNIMLRAFPLFLKNIGMKLVYNGSARANTSTLTNLGVITVDEAYRDYIESFYALLSMSKGQNLKGAVCSYNDTLVFSLSAAVRETDVQKEFIRRMTEDGIHVEIETNGVYDESLSKM